jgi:hypothetical protein
MAICLQLDSIGQEDKEYIKKMCIVKPKATAYVPRPAPYQVCCTRKLDNEIYLPLRLWPRFFDAFPFSPDVYPTISIKFNGNLFTKQSDPTGRKRDQDNVVTQATEQLTKYHSTFIACHTGFGKTTIGAYFISLLAKKTAIICHIDEVKKQWRDEIVRFCPTAKVQIVGKKIDSSADVLIFGVQQSSKLIRSDVIDVGVVIIDEAHVCTATAFTKSLLKFQPYYLIGMSATPDRSDGLHRFLPPYFGSMKNFIVRREKKNFTVVKYQTSYVPDLDYRLYQGRMVPDWNKVINSLAENQARNVEIAKLAIKHPEHKIIILCDRQVCAKAIYEYLVEADESVELYISDSKKLDRSKRIMVVGIKKGGTGLNYPDLTMLILEADRTDVRQYEGRIRTTDNLIYDIVDDYLAFENHWSKREAWYIEKGATIKVYGQRRSKEHPRFLKP